MLFDILDISERRRTRFVEGAERAAFPIPKTRIETLDPILDFWNVARSIWDRGGRNLETRGAPIAIVLEFSLRAVHAAPSGGRRQHHGQVVMARAEIELRPDPVFLGTIVGQ